MDYSSNEVKSTGLNQTSGVAPSGHILHKSEDPIRPVGSSDFNAASTGGHVLHKSSDPIRPVDSGFSSQPIGSDLSTSTNRSNDSAFSLPVGASSRPLDSSYSSQPLMSDFSSSSSRPIDSSYSSQPVLGSSGLSSQQPISSSSTTDYSGSGFSGSNSGVIFKGGDIVRKTDDIHQDVREAGISNVEPAVQDTRDAAQNLMWELEREKQRKADMLLQEQELERQRRLREVPTEQAIEKTEQVIQRANEIKKEAKSEGLKNAVPAAEETRDAAKELKKELENERKNLEPHKEGFLDRAKEWFAGDRDKSSDSDYDAERRLHSDSDRKHHDAMVKEINKRDRVGDEKEGILDRAKGWFSKDDKDDTKPVVPEYQEARMNHPDLVVKHHDDVVDDINKRDRVGEEGLIQKVKHLFKGSSSAESDNSKPVVSAPTHPVHNFQENPTSTGNLPATNVTSFPTNTQTVFLPEQRFNLPTAAASDMSSSGISDNNNNNNSSIINNNNLSSNLNNDSSSTWSSSSQFGSGSSNVNSDINSASTFNPTTHFPISNNEAPATSYSSAPSSSTYPFGSGSDVSTSTSTSTYPQPSTSSSNTITSSNPFLSSSSSSASSYPQGSQLPLQQQQQQQQQQLPQQSQSYDMGNSSIDNSSLFNPSTSSLSSTGPNPQGPLNTRLDSGIHTTHAQLHHPSGTRQADV